MFEERSGRANSMEKSPLSQTTMGLCGKKVGATGLEPATIKANGLTEVSPSAAIAK
jgi:hypothetical protein